MFQKLHGTGAQGNMQTFYDGRINSDDSDMGCVVQPASARYECA